VSYDLSLIGIYDGETRVSLFSRNATYNYQPATEAAGLRSLNDLHGLKGRKAARILAKTLTTLEEHPEMGDLIRGGGTWGTYEDLLEVLRDLRDASRAWPKATWEVS